MKTRFAATAAALLFSSAIVASASAATIDFTTTATGPVTTLQGVTFSMSGGPNPATTPVVTGVFGDSTTSLTNSDTNDYPTNSMLTATFSGLASSVSFTFNNYGTTNGSFYEARGASGNLISTGIIDFSNDFTNFIGVSGSGIKTLTWNNNTNGLSDWQFGVGALSFTAAGVPEPATWGLMILGFGAVGGAMRRRQSVAAKVRFA